MSTETRTGQDLNLRVIHESKYKNMDSNSDSGSIFGLLVSHIKF